MYVRVAQANGVTTRANGPVNDCKRAVQVVNWVISGFRGQALIWWQSLDYATVRPRTLVDHRFEGQIREIGLLNLVKEKFLPPSAANVNGLSIERINYNNYTSRNHFFRH